MKQKPKTSWELVDFISYLKDKGYKSSGEFKANEKGYYIAASKKQLIDKIREHFGWIKNKEVYMLPNALAMANQFDNYKDWENSVHFEKSKGKGIQKAIKVALNWSTKYTFESCLQSTKYIRSFIAWRNKQRPFYDAAVQFGWVEKICEAKNWNPQRRITIGKMILAAAKYEDAETLKQHDKQTYKRMRKIGCDKKLFETTIEIKKQVLKAGLTKAIKMKINSLPLTPLLKDKLIKQCFRLAT